MLKRRDAPRNRFTLLRQELEGRLLKMETIVEFTMHHAVRAAVERSPEQATAVFSRWPQIKQLEYDIDEFATRLLALYQPKPVDLRAVAAGLLISRDLRQIGDWAVSIARRGVSLTKKVPVRLPPGLAELANRVQLMLSKSVQAFAQRQLSFAADAIAQDGVDRPSATAYEYLVTYLQEHPQTAAQEVDLIYIIHDLERIAGCAVNIAKDVMLFIGGTDREGQSRQGAPLIDTAL
jgi:phosphate transport system regulatory protein PhoU